MKNDASGLPFCEVSAYVGTPSLKKWCERRCFSRRSISRDAHITTRKRCKQIAFLRGDGVRWFSKPRKMVRCAAVFHGAASPTVRMSQRGKDASGLPFCEVSAYVGTPSLKKWCERRCFSRRSISRDAHITTRKRCKQIAFLRGDGVRWFSKPRKMVRCAAVFHGAASPTVRMSQRGKDASGLPFCEVSAYVGTPNLEKWCGHRCFSWCRISRDAHITTRKRCKQIAFLRGDGVHWYSKPRKMV